MDETFDFVIVGSGGGSMCAALVLREAGKSVLIVEKTDMLGGSTARAGGVMWVPCNRFLAEAGIADSPKKAETYLDATVGTHADSPGAAPERRATYVREATRMVDFLTEQGIRLRRGPYWPDYYDERAGGIEPGRTVVPELFDINRLGKWKDKLRANNITIPAPFEDLFKLTLFKRSWRGRVAMARTAWRIALAKVTGKSWVIAGAALQGRMLEQALARGVEFRLDAPVTEVIVEGGAAKGIVTTGQDGTSRRIGARMGVLLNAGGFAWNQEMRDRYMPGTRNEWTHAAPGDTGDMHREMMRLGAQMAQMDEFIGNQMTVPPGVGPMAVQQQLTKPHAFLVDQSGVRYMNECGSYMEFCQGIIKREKTVPAIPSWMVFDHRFIQDYMLGSSMPGSNKPARWYDERYLRKGTTIEALAGEIGVDPGVLRATTERFNMFAKAGKDEDFGRGDRAYDRFLGDFTHRPVSTLGAIETGPYYAVPVVPGDVGTFGGVVTDCDAQVIREDGSTITGLYATGTTTASVMGRAYVGAGCSIGPAFTWGFVAAKHALARATNAG